VEEQKSQCSAAKMRPTATGEVEVRCTKEPGHVEAGDLDHLGMTGVFPLKWRDEPS
jgi:hypothetical protein